MNVIMVQTRRWFESTHYPVLDWQLYSPNTRRVIATPKRNIISKISLHPGATISCASIVLQLRSPNPNVWLEAYEASPYLRLLWAKHFQFVRGQCLHKRDSKERSVEPQMRIPKIFQFGSEGAPRTYRFRVSKLVPVRWQPLSHPRFMYHPIYETFGEVFLSNWWISSSYSDFT